MKFIKLIKAEDYNNEVIQQAKSTLNFLDEAMDPFMNEGYFSTTKLNKLLELAKSKNDESFTKFFEDLIKAVQPLQEFYKSYRK